MTRYKSDAERYKALEKQRKKYAEMQERLKKKKTQKTVLRKHVPLLDNDNMLEQDSKEDSEGDGLMSEGDIMFPSEDEDD